MKDCQPIVCWAAGTALPHAGYREFVAGGKKDYCGIFWCGSGSAEFEISGKTVRLFAGDVICYSPGDGHSIDVKTSGFFYCWAVWNGVLAESILKAYGIVPGEKIHLDTSLKDKFNTLFDTLRINTPESSCKGGVVLYDILSMVSESLNKIKTVKRESANSIPLIEMFKELVLSEFHDPDLNLNSISSRLGVHRATVARAVKKHLGMAPGEYLHDVRLKVALGRLKSSLRPVNEIVRECGFSSASYFARIVREQTGLSPKKYRDNG